MVAQVMNICMQGVSACFGWMGILFESLGAWSFILGAITLYTIFRLLLAPVIGAAISSGASDTVKNFKKENTPKGKVK